MMFLRVWSYHPALQVVEGWVGGWKKQSHSAKKCSLGVSKLHVLLEASAKVGT